MFTLSAGAAGIQVLHGHVPEAAKQLRAVQSLPDSKRLDLVFSLPLRNRDTLTNLLRQIYDPASPAYHHYLSPAEFTAQFGPTMADYEALVAFARSNGFAITGRHANRTLLDVNGAVADIRKTLHVNLRQYKHPVENRMFYAPDAEPSLNLAVPVLAISGLDNFNLPRPMGIVTNYLNQPLNAMPYSTGSGPRGNFIGRDFRVAYAPGVSLNGSGQAVGLFELDGYYPSDILAYASLAGLPQAPLTNVLVDGFNQPPGSANVEVALDIDMAICMAPGLSKVIVYEGVSPNDVLNQMAMDDSARQLSCSWGFGSPVDPAREQIFQQFALQGQSFFQASGDVGGGNIYPPSDDPLVTVVGGTSLTTTNPGGAWQSETAWPDSSGGISGNYPIPVWQQGVNMMLNQGSSTMRNVPDVACLADTVIWLIYNRGDAATVGGTSASAPLWAGFAALANQQAAANGQPPIGFINPAIYAAAGSSSYTTIFHDITTGNNTNSSSPNHFFAVPGYDLCTGWGTPAGSNLINALLAPPDALQINPAAILSFTGTGGNLFIPSIQTYTLTNDGLNALNWGLMNTSLWLSASSSNGTLSAGGPAVTVNITPASSLTNLPAGTYSATLWFTNLNDGFVQSRLVIFNRDVSPVITSQPVGQTVMQGANVSFSVGAAANGTLNYQWRQDNGSYQTNLSDGGNIFGSATSTLTLSNISPANVGAYSVVVSNTAGAVTSSNAFLSIVPWRPVITTQPLGQSALPGQSVILGVISIGSQPLFYQWQQNGTNLTDSAHITGSTAANLLINDVSPTDAGSYSVTVSNALGKAASTGAVLTV
ncbi:MAG TPA: protease pro-enzyme activation domain-containing protein, partial [Candidatus Acidoferrum sp.]|nr:protease pro-enzyme activation domain-containing protein [Candidatus Acidoferrum sp.]